MAAPKADVRLLERIRQDAPGAFEEFVESWQDRIFGFGLRMCGEREDAKDVLQDTLLQAFRSLKRLEHPEALKSWIFRVASNACLMKRRKGKFEPDRELSLEDLTPKGPSDLGPQIPDPGSLPDEDASRHELQHAVREVIQKLPPHYRAVVVLRDLEQLTTKEASVALELPETAVKMRLHRGRLMVRKELQRFLDDGDGHAA